MSSCKAPNCDLKNFDQCNSSLQFCSIEGISSGEALSTRECNPKDTGILNYLRKDSECNLASSVNGEFECGKKVGCEWRYPRIATNNLLEKKCLPNRKGARGDTGLKREIHYTCSEPSDDNTLGSWKIGSDTDDKGTGRYSYPDKIFTGVKGILIDAPK